MPYVETDGSRIFLFAEWEPGIADKCKSIVGHRWHPDYERKPWSYPLRMSTCTSLRNVWGSRLEIGPKLWSWAFQEAAKAKALREVARLPDSPLRGVQEAFPDMWGAMSRRTYQRSGAAFLSGIKNGADFDEPGLGKTLTAIAAIVEAGRWDGRHLVICPKTAIFSTWVEEIQKWTDGRAYGMPDGFRQREDVLCDFFEDVEPGGRFLIVHPNMIQIKMGYQCKKCKMIEGEGDWPDVHWEDNHNLSPVQLKNDWPELYEKDTWDSVTADECQKYLLKLRPPGGKRVDAQPQWANGMRALIKAIKPDGLRMPLTGTPFRGKEENIFGILHWLDPERFSSFWQWAGAYLEVEDKEHSEYTGATHKVVGSIRAGGEQAFYDMLDSLSLRRTRAEVRGDLPAMDIQEHWVEMSGAQKKQYEEFESMGIAQLESGVIESLGILSELTRLRQFAFGAWDIEYYMKRNKKLDVDEQKMRMTPLMDKSAKVELLMDMLEARGAFGEFQGGDRKFIVASQWTKIIDGLEEMFRGMSVPTLKITGAVVGKNRASAVRSFRDPGGARILLLNTTAGGTSLTLDAQCDEMFVLDETWIHDDQVQLRGRIDNRGQDIRPRVCHLILTRGTVEEGIKLGNTEQENMQSKILDGRRGVKFAKSLLTRGA